MGTDRTIRVFISSTFRDMNAERDHLVTVVFPELRERIEQLGLEFFDVDLRWGVPAKDVNGETANSWEYCRQWIDRVEPFFVCLLGQRYGWEPEPEQLKDADDRWRQRERSRSITEMEVHHAVLDTKLNRRSYFYLRAAEAPVTAAEYVDPPARLQKLDLLKREVRACGRPVRDYPCQWTGSGFTGLEEFGRRVLEDLWSGVLRDERYVSREVWQPVLGTEPANDPRYTDDSQPVPRELWEQIVALAHPEPKEPLEAERQQMEAFAATRLRWFHGRTEVLGQLTDFIDANLSDAPRLAIVVAVPGQGKSALLARLYEQLKPSPHLVIAHFVGATERSAGAYSLVERLLGELDRAGLAPLTESPAVGAEQKRDFHSRCHQLAQRLGDYAGAQQIVILLDALNQMSDGHELAWLPRRLGPSVRVIVSCVDDPTAAADGPEQRVLQALATRPATLRLPLGPLTEDDVRTIAVAYLAEYCHELDHEHLETLCGIPQSRNPLYLLVMLNELRTLGGNDLNLIVPRLIAQMPLDHPDTVSLFRWVLQRMEVFGAEPVKWWCLYLAHGRVGMTSHELSELLAHKFGADAAVTALLIERGLRRYLQRRGPQLDFFHGQLRQAVGEQFGVQTDASSIFVNQEMASYFKRQPTWQEVDHLSPASPASQTKSDIQPTRRKLAELPYHLIQAQLWEGVEETLCDLGFIEAKCIAGMLYDLLRDFDRAIEVHDLPAVAQVRKALALVLPSLAARPALALQTIYNRLRWFDAMPAQLRASLEIARAKLNEQPTWIGTEATAPVGQAESCEIAFGIMTPIQSVSLESGTIAIASHDGKVEIRSLAYGELLEQKKLGVTRINAIAMHEVSNRLAYLDARGEIRVENSTATLAGRKSENLLTYDLTEGILAVREDNALVAWHPDRNESTVLDANLPAPLIVLRSNRVGNGSSVLYIAGYKHQRLGVATRAGSDWSTSTLPYDGPNVVDADLDSEARCVLLSCLDRHLRIVDLATGDLLAQLAYETRPDVTLRGAPVMSRLGNGDSSGWAFAATSNGQIFKWNWRDDRVEHLVNYSSRSEATNLIHLEVLPSSGRLFLSTETNGRIIPREGGHTPLPGHSAAVTGIVLTPSAQVVSISSFDRTIRWFSAVGLKLKGHQPVHQPAIIALRSETEDVLVGSEQGKIWNQPPGIEVAPNNIGTYFDEPVVSLVSLDNERVLAAGKSGRVLRINLLTDQVELIRRSKELQKQERILPAGKHGLFWSVRLENHVGGIDTVIALARDRNREDVVLTFPTKILWDIAVSQEGATICLATDDVQVFREIANKWTRLYERDVAVTHLAFLNQEDLIAVVLRDSRWLEVWQIAEGLPTIAAIDLPGEVSCLTATEEWIAVGFLSGQLLTARLRRCKA